MVGIFYGCTDGTQRAYVSNAIREEHKGIAFGYLNAMVGFGLLFSGVIGGYLWQNFGYLSALSTGIIIVSLGLLVLSASLIKKVNA